MLKPRAASRADGPLSNFGRLVRRVVQDLDFEQLLRVVHLADRTDQPVRDVHFVEDGKLNGDWRQRRRQRHRARDPILVFHVKIHKVVPVPAVDRQDAQDEEVKDEDQGLRQRHKKMNPSRYTIADFIARLNGKSTNANHLGR